MKYRVLSAGFLFISSYTAFSQDELSKADGCYDKKEYDCALTNYLTGYNKAAYTADKKYLVEFRLGFCYNKANKKAESKTYYLKSIYSKSDYGYSWWNVGHLLYDEYKYDSAITCYRKALQYLTNQDDRDNVLYWIGWAYNSKKNYSTAISEFKRILSRTAKNRLIDLYISELYLNDRYYDSALVYGLKAKNYISPSDSMYGLLQYDIAKIYRGKTEYGKALEALDIAESANTKLKKNTEWERGLLYNDKKEYAKSTEHYTKSLPYYKGDTVNIRALLGNIVKNYRNQPDYPGLIKALQNYLPYATGKQDSYKEIAMVQYGKLNQPKEALKTAESSLALWGNGLDTTQYGMKTWKSNMLALQGLIALNGKDSSKAIKYFTDALKYDFSNLTANLRMGDIYWNRNKPDEYKKYYSGASVSSPDTLMNSNTDMARAYARKAHVRYNYYSYKASEIKTDIESALKYDSIQKEAVYLWAVALKDHYSLVTYRDRCIGVLDKGIKKYTTDKKYISDLYNAKGVLLDTKKDTAGTRKAFEEGIKTYPDNLSIWDNLMKHHQAQKNETAGQATSEKLITLLKKNKDSKQLATAFVYKGDFLWRQDKKEEAKKAYNEALVWDPDNTTAKDRVKM